MRRCNIETEMLMQEFELYYEVIGHSDAIALYSVMRYLSD